MQQREHIEDVMNFLEDEMNELDVKIHFKKRDIELQGRNHQP